MSVLSNKPLTLTLNPSLVWSYAKYPKHFWCFQKQPYHVQDVFFCIQTAVLKRKISLTICLKVSGLRLFAKHCQEIWNYFVGWNIYLGYDVFCYREVMLCCLIWWKVHKCIFGKGCSLVCFVRSGMSVYKDNLQGLQVRLLKFKFQCQHVQVSSFWLDKRWSL